MEICISSLPWQNHGEKDRKIHMDTNVSLSKSHLLYRHFTLIALFVILCPQEGLGKWGRARLRRKLWGTAGLEAGEPQARPGSGLRPRKLHTKRW